MKVRRRSVPIYWRNSPEAKKSKFVKFHILFGKKKTEKMGKIEKLRETNVENVGKNISAKNDPRRGMQIRFGLNGFRLASCRGAGVGSAPPYLR